MAWWSCTGGWPCMAMRLWTGVERLLAGTGLVLLCKSHCDPLA